MDQCIEVDFQYRFMGFHLENLADLFKFEQAGPFQQNRFILKGRKGKMMQEFIGSEIKEFQHGKTFCMLHQVATNPYDFCDVLRLQQGVDLAVKPFLVAARLQNVGEDDGLLPVLVLLIQKIQGNAQRVDVGIVAVVDQGAAIDCLFQLEPHGNRRQY